MVKRHGFKEVGKHAPSNRAEVTILDLDCMETAVQQ